jgi:hypothetical protein
MWTTEYTLRTQASLEALWELLSDINGGARGTTGSRRSLWMGRSLSGPPSG